VEKHIATTEGCRGHMTVIWNHTVVNSSSHVPQQRALIVVLDVGCLSAGGLTGTFQHRDLDDRILALPDVRWCKQHGWVTEDDDSVPLDICIRLSPWANRWVRLPWVRRRRAWAVRNQVETIFEELLPHYKGPEDTQGDSS
jgi:hypothetical protein